MVKKHRIKLWKRIVDTPNRIIWSSAHFGHIIEAQKMPTKKGMKWVTTDDFGYHSVSNTRKDAINTAFKLMRRKK